MGNKLPDRIESQMVNFETLIEDVKKLNDLFRYIISLMKHFTHSFFSD